MAITKLMNLKESKKGNPARHLKNCIRYIMNEEKTIGGALAGGNVGIATPEESLQDFLFSKENYNKLEGRQGYHFVVSFQPGEVGYEEAYQIIQEWAEQYLGDRYDYVFAVHTDRNHIHGHIVFNSVCRVDGYKYHYRKGDWEKYIQPITDKVCEAHGLSPLCFEEKETDRSYADWMKRKQNGFTEKDIYRADIDRVIGQVSSYEEFKIALLRMGYTIQREGYSKKTEQEYLTLKAPGLPRGRRTDKLGPAYSLAAIKERTRTKEGPHMDRELSSIMRRQFQPVANRASSFSRSTFLYSRAYNACHFYEIRTIPHRPDWKIRKDILELNWYIDALSYVSEAGFETYDDIREHIEKAEQELTALKSERYSLQHLWNGLGEEEKRIAERYHQLKHEQEKNSWSDKWEEAADEIEQIEQHYDYNVYSLTDRIEYLTLQMKTIRSEQKYKELILEDQDPVSSEQELEDPEISQ